jgi:hypothetical protein
MLSLKVPQAGLVSFLVKSVGQKPCFHLCRSEVVPGLLQDPEQKTTIFTISYLMVAGPKRDPLPL